MKKFFTTLKEADIRNILAIIIVLASFVLQYTILFKPVPKDNHDIAITTVVLTLGLQSMVGAYYYGASKPERKIVNEKPET